MDDYFSRIDAVTLEEANAVARRYYKTEKLTFVVLGNDAKIRQTVAQYEPKMVEVSVTKPGLGEFGQP